MIFSKAHHDGVVLTISLVTRFIHLHISIYVTFCVLARVEFFVFVHLNKKTTWFSFFFIPLKASDNSTTITMTIECAAFLLLFYVLFRLIHHHRHRHRHHHQTIIKSLMIFLSIFLIFNFWYFTFWFLWEKVVWILYLYVSG